jgi:hypothetical protein
MKVQAHIAKRFIELEKEMNNLPRDRENDKWYDTASWRQWATSVMNLIKGVFGETSPHYENIQMAYSECNGHERYVEGIKGIFKAAKADFDGSYLFNLQASVSGEIFGDFVSLAKAILQENFKDVAAVLACAALEDALKRYADLNGLDVNNKVMQEVVSAIKSKGLVTGAQKTLLDSMPKIRDYAMHANWEKITSQDVGSVIGFVEQFLLTHFS